MSTGVGEQRSALLSRITYPLLAFLSVVVFGVLAFIITADIGIIEAIFWVVDPTSIELHYQDHGGETVEKISKSLSVFLRAMLVVTGAWIAESVLSVAFGGRIGRELRTVQAKNDIEKLTDHVVVCGYGMFGRTVADKMKEKGVPVVVIEYEDNEFERALSDHLAIKGDTRREGVLKEAGVERARSVIGAVDDSNVNIQTSVVVSQVAPDCRMVVRVGDEMYESLARRAGADEVVIPEVMSGESITNGI